MKIDKELIFNRIKSYYGFSKDKELADFLEITPQKLTNWKNRDGLQWELIYSKCVEMDFNYLIKGVGQAASGNEIHKSERKINENAEEEILNLYRKVSKLQDKIEALEAELTEAKRRGTA